MILFFSFMQNNQYDFAEIYKNDIENLKLDDHSSNVSNKNKITTFKKFTSINISKFKVAEYNNKNKFNVLEWTSKNQNVSLIKRVTKCAKTPNGLCLNFVGYKFVDKQNTYYYITVESQGLIEYSIDKKVYHITNELIIVGLDDIYFETKTPLSKGLDA